jgi:hypothetical protein
VKYQLAQKSVSLRGTASLISKSITKYQSLISYTSHLAQSHILHVTFGSFLDTQIFGPWARLIGGQASVVHVRIISGIRSNIEYTRVMWQDVM